MPERADEPPAPPRLASFRQHQEALVFSFGLMTDISPRLGEHARFAEEHGFGYFWLLDSPVNWREMSLYLTLIPALRPLDH
jgi:alkanesulfonate monooxygenase SsuD/methylene tetrahydromethanopterin reductase-like flavin-dependent oxidoreductase (luciferase family)